MNAKTGLRKRKLWLPNVTSLTRRVLAPHMCLFVALDVLQKKYEKSPFLKFNLLHTKEEEKKLVGGLNANTEISFSFASCHLR